MCSNAEIRDELHAFREEWRREVAEVRMLRQDVDNLEQRVTAIEKTYLTIEDIKAAINATIAQPLADINETLKKFADDIAPWREREMRWNLTQRITRKFGTGITHALVSIGQAAVGIAAIYGVGTWLGLW